MNNILQSRILPHKISGKIVNREDLIGRISNNIGKGLILINAPAGYGKSSLTQEFLAKSDFAFSWLNVHSEMNNFYVFMSYLIYSIEKMKKGFGIATILLIEEYRERYQLSKHLERIINDITDSFINDLIISFELDSVIVLDDLGNIENTDWLKIAFDKIFDTLPSNIHFIITTRSVPEFNLSALQAKRNIFKIETKELSFTFEETKRLVNEIYGIVSDEEEIKHLSENLSGWITGMHLILQSHGSSFPELRLDKIIILDDIFSYFTEDIFKSLKPEVRDFLIFTSILDNFSIELCDKLLHLTISGNIINELLHKNIFILIDPYKGKNGIIIYSYQVLFKKFLNIKLKELRSEKEINNFLAKVSEHFISQGDFISAINYSLQAKDYTLAVKMIHENFQSCFDSGNFEILWKWLDALDEELIKSDFILLYFKSLLLKFYKGSIEESIPLLNSAIKLCNQSNDPEFLVKCLISKSRNLISLGRITEAIKVLKSAGEIKTDDLSKAKLLFLTAYSVYQNAKYDKAIDILNDALTLIEESSDFSESSVDIREEIYNLYGHIFLIRGDYSKSISHYERVANNTVKIIRKYETLCNLVLLYSQSGKFEKAEIYLTRAKEITDSITNPIFRITYLLACQALKYEFGDYEESIRLLEEMNNISAELNHKYYISLSYSLIGDCYYSLNKLSKAEEYYDMAFRYLNDNNELEKIQYSVSKALMLKKAEPIAEIEPVLLKAYKFYEEKKMVYSKFQTAFHLADYNRRTDNLQKCVHFLSEALNISEEKEYTAFLQREINDFRQLFDIALANNIQVKFIKEILGSFMEKIEVSWVSSECRNRLLNAYNSVYDIKLNLLGKNEVILRGRILEDTEWSKKKWKFIFIYLMFSQKKILTKDKVIDMFYPDTKIESADNIFHQIISRYRNLIKLTYDKEGVLEPKNIDNFKSKRGKKIKLANEVKTFPQLIIYEDKMLQISDNFIFYIDSNEFEKLYKQVLFEKDPVKKTSLLKQAIEMYKGDFMEGNYDTWCEELRTKYRSYFISMSEELVKLLFSEGDNEGVVHYSENLLKFDKLNITAYEYIINSMMKINKPQIAKIRYSQLIKYYKKEYDESLPLGLSKRFENIITV